MRKLMNKRVAVVVAVVAALAAATSAYAYFTANGSGTGSASVGNSSPVSLAGTITGTLYPGGSAASVSVLVTNNGNGSQYVNAVHLASIQIDQNSAAYMGASAAQQALWNACDVSSSGSGAAFTMADISVATDLAKGGTVTKTGSLQMNDTGVSQDNCQGAPLQLNFTSN